MIEESINRRNWPEAVGLLCEGFPGSKSEFWQSGRDRWRQVHSDNPDKPFGYIGRDKEGVAQTVLLTLRSPVPTEDGLERVNFSSWYVRERYRLFAPNMLKRLCNDSNCVYTDFTPSKSVEKMLDRFGYQFLGLDHIVFPTPAIAFRKSLSVVGKAATLEAVKTDPDLSKLLKDHDQFGCLIMGIKTDDGISPIVLRTMVRKRVLRSAEVIFAQDVANLVRALPAIARILLLRGYSLLEADLPEGQQIKLPHHNWGRSTRYAKGPWRENQINFSYSELPVLKI